MTEIQVKDEGGEEITMIDFGEYRSSKFGCTTEQIVEINRQLPEFKFRDGDVLLCSYPKAGCTWSFEILTMLLRGRVEGSIPSKLHTMLEATDQATLDNMVGPRLLNTHLPVNRLPGDIIKKQVKVILVVRNPKDVAVSLYNMMHGFKHYNYRGKFEHWLPLYMRGHLAYDTFWRYYTDWEESLKSRVFNDNLLIVNFEDMKQNISQEIKRLSNFLKCSLTDSSLRDISNACQFKEMKTRFTPDKLGTGSYRSEVSQTFMRKGAVGDWMNWFTVRQNEQMDSLLATHMGDTSLQLIYRLASE